MNIKMIKLIGLASLISLFSFISCKQPETPVIPDVPEYKFPEKELAVSKMDGRSKFGRNEIRFSFVNYADPNAYELYRFYNDEIIGVPIFKDKSVNSELKSVEAMPNFDSIAIIDRVSKDNPMLPGTYTYKLIAKGAKSYTDSSSTPRSTKDVDPSKVYLLPSIAEIKIYVSESNMPKPGSKLPLNKQDLIGKYSFDKKTNKLCIYPELDDNLGIYDDYDYYDLEARLAGIGPDFEFNNSNNTLANVNTSFTSSKNDAGKDKTNNIVELTLPTTKSGKYEIYATRKYENEYYLDSDEVLIDTVTIDPIGDVNGNVSVFQLDTLNQSNVLAWALDKDLNYNFEAVRAECIGYKYSDHKEGINVQNTYYYGDVTPVKFDITSFDKLGPDGKTVQYKCYMATDKTAQIGKTYRYFWKFKDVKNGNKIVDYGETEITVKSKTATTITTYLDIKDITESQLVPYTKDNAYNCEWYAYTNNFTLELKPKQDSYLASNIFNTLTYEVTRVSSNGSGYNKVETVPVSAIKEIPGSNGQKFISISETLPFAEDTKATSIKYWFNFKDGSGNNFEAFNIDTTDVVPLSKKRYEYTGLDLNYETIGETTYTRDFTIKIDPIKYNNRADNIPILPNNYSSPSNAFVIKYDLRNVNDNCYVFEGKTLDLWSLYGQLSLTDLKPGITYRVNIKVAYKEGVIESGKTVDYTFDFTTKMRDLNKVGYSFTLDNNNFSTPSVNSNDQYFKDSKCSYSGSIDIKNTETEYVNLNNYELKKVYRIATEFVKDDMGRELKYEPVDLLSKEDFYYNLYSNSIYINDSGIPFNNEAKKIAYKFELYDRDKCEYATFVTTSLIAKPYNRYLIDANVTKKNGANPAPGVTEVLLNVQPSITKLYDNMSNFYNGVDIYIDWTLDKYSYGNNKTIMNIPYNQLNNGLITSKDITVTGLNLGITQTVYVRITWMKEGKEEHIDREISVKTTSVAP